ncbi:anaerobic carbon-monoxide dehydrogenase catalytic subunit [Desulfallas thermosapovorans]|uniref:anaerobic carbon-monoxide dehydrogenase n=1 Tax=Desulfallas thermosapovorans DSM 6562 TaxID=1121431 RepID=A0A5S4ZQJ7_9FIRM|nr:anaerobic carbon-monoxide dehydrogenase catalytic subunit [Desulfallas thermosapovorans]TYO93881.1 Ni-dependent carbon monoxide dehydrogenase precursor [Desulfallas thermosapovorans DSM 6562]
MSEKSVDKATLKMIKKAGDDNVKLAWDRLVAQQPQCGFGQLGVCCRNCNMGPCRIDPFGDGPDTGVCGADADTIVARNLLRAIAAGAAAHSDHGRGIAATLYASARGEARDYPIKDEAKLKAVATEFGIVVEGRSVQEIALELAGAVLEEFGTKKGSLQFINRAPVQRRELWDKLGITPRGIDREVVESMHRTHMGVDNDYTSLILQGLRTALSDGWGGSCIATELSDILFGTPQPVKGVCNLGVLMEDQVNIILHGHEPTLSDIIVFAARDEELLAEARQRGASGINVCGMCCTGNEVLMRHGVPLAGNFLQQELAIVTGAVEAVIVDVQCIMPSLPQIAGCYHTKVISTSPKAKFPGALHVPFDEHNAMEVAKKILRLAVENYSNRRREKVSIPSDRMEYMAGFSVEALLAALGGTLSPLIDALKSGSVKGIAGVVGCNNPKYRQDYSHLTFIRELIKNDILVVATGCAAIACAKDGMLLPGAADEAGEGLKAVCKGLNVPPVLHMGSCVDISRILTVAAAIANALGVDIADLPLVGAAPEWMSEKAVSIGAYVIGSGIFTILGTVPPVLGSKNVAALLTSGADEVIGAKFAVEEDPVAAAELAVKHIAGKRVSLGLKA